MRHKTSKHWREIWHRQVHASFLFLNLHLAKRIKEKKSCPLDSTFQHKACFLEPRAVRSHDPFGPTRVRGICPPPSLLLHGVLDGPPLTGAGLQDQQVAKVNVSRHHLQTPARGPVYDGVVLQEEEQNRQILQVLFCSLLL